MTKRSYINEANNRLVTEQVVREHGQKPQVVVDEKRIHGNYSQQEKKRTFARRRVGAAVGAAGLSAGLALMAGSTLGATASEGNPLKVDREAIEALSPEEQATKYDTIRVGGDDGERGLSGIAEEYAQEHQLDYSDVLESLTIQARQIDIAAERPMNEHIIQPGEEYFIPRG